MDLLILPALVTAFFASILLINLVYFRRKRRYGYRPFAPADTPKPEHTFDADRSTRLGGSA